MRDQVFVLLLVDAVICAVLGAIVGSQKDAKWMGAFLGGLFGPLGVIATFAVDLRPQCPKCTTRLNGRAAVCPSCREELTWWANENGETFPIDAAEAAKRSEREEPRLRKDRERDLELAERRAAGLVGVGPILAGCLAGLASTIKRAAIRVAKGIDGGLYRRIDGGENVLVYRFLQVLLYLVAPVTIIVAVAIYLHLF